jgi:hypothetical protein
MNKLVVGGILFGIAALAPGAVHAQGATTDKPRFEVSVAFVSSSPRQDGTYSTSFAPPFDPGEHSGSAGQTVALSLDRATGFGITAGFFPRPRYGVQVLVNRFESPFGGANTPYEVLLTYVALQPPDFQPREYVYQRAQDWPDTEGALRSLSVSANAALRIGEGPVGAVVSGGPSIFRTGGEAQALGYTRLWLGGHSVLFLEESVVEVAVQPRTTLGFNAGGELVVALHGPLAVVFDGRYFYAPSSASHVRVTRILNFDELISPESIEVIQERMDLQPARLDASFLRLGAGLKLRW